MRTPARTNPILALFLTLALLLAACGAGQAGAGGVGAATQATPTTVGAAHSGEPSRVTLALDYTPNTNHTGIYVAQQKGWYEEAGIELKILPYAEGANTDQLVSTGKADFGISYEESVVLSRAAGQDVLSLAAVIQHNTSALVTLKESGLDTPRKLDGKRYAGFGAPFEEPVISTMIRHDGGQGTFKAITANLYGYDAVKAGKADFVWIFMGWDGVAAERSGIDLNAFYIKDHGVPDYYTPVIVTSNEKAEADPDTVRRFMRATARGYEYAIEHPRESADLLIQGAPQGSFADPEFVRASQEWLSPRYKEGQQKWGTQDPEVWTEYPRFMYETGKVVGADGKPVKQEPEYEAYFTNEFLP